MRKWNVMLLALLLALLPAAGMAQDLPQLFTEVYESIGVYLGHILAFYCELYGAEHVLLLGRVMSGKGGEIIVDTSKAVLSDEYPEYASLAIHLPDEKFRRVGQSMAAASLPATK